MGCTQDIRLLVSNSYLLHEGEKLSVSISIGGTIARPGDSQETLLKRADDYLYASKSAGRNRVTIDPVPGKT